MISNYKMKAKARREIERKRQKKRKKRLDYLEGVSGQAGDDSSGSFVGLNEFTTFE